MTKAEIIADLHSREEIKKIITNATKDQYYREELLSEVFTILANLPEEKLSKEYGNGIEKYIGGIVKNLFKSKTSKFYRQIKKPRQLVNDYNDKDQIQNTPDNEDNYHQLLTNVEREFSKLSWFDRTIFQHFADGKTIKQISIETNINRTYISGIIKRVKAELKHNIRKDL